MRLYTKEKSPGPSLLILKNRLDIVFSQFIKLRDMDERGTITCFVTGERIYYKDSEAAHYVHRGNMATRWDEMNVHATTIESNRYDPKHQEDYRDKMILKYGYNAMIDLEGKGKSLYKWTRPELEEKIEHYREKVKGLKKQKGI